MKVQKIKLQNFKAIKNLEIDFKGCTAIISAGNDKGKTSFLKGIIDRIRFISPEVMVNKDEESGKGELTLDTCEKFVWDFDKNGKDKLTYIDREAVKQNVTVELGKKLFPQTFDIDKFLQSTPKEQSKQLQKIVGIDFTDIDDRYKKAYDLRTSKNADAEKFHVKLSQMLKVDKVDFVDLTELKAKKETERHRLNELYLENKGVNDTARNIWNQAKADIDEEIAAFNKKQSDLTNKYNAVTDAASILIINGYKGTDVESFIESIKSELKPQKKASDFYPAEPKYITELPDDTKLQKIDEEILTASEINTDAQKYKDYIDYKKQTDAAKVEADQADDDVKAIEKERNDLINTANFPKGITIDHEGIKVEGFPLDKNQISTSKMYTTALRIASMNLGSVRTLYFDASYLDNITLCDIENWAHENDLQLLIERPDRDGGEIKYELIEQ